MNDVTQVLSQIANGDAKAASQLLPLIYDELRRLAAARVAREGKGITLDATALVHEAYLKLVGPVEKDKIKWDSRGHFFAAAATAMRRILVDRARQKKRRGANVPLIPELHAANAAPSEPDNELLALDAALEKLAEQDPIKARLVELRYFAGLTNVQAAEILGIAPRTADRQWAFVRAWLKNEVRGAKE
ncbi:MAG: ECF-type sigma factor [Planctomycetota bacterium]